MIKDLSVYVERTLLPDELGDINFVIKEMGYENMEQFLTAVYFVGYSTDTGDVRTTQHFYQKVTNVRARLKDTGKVLFQNGLDVMPKLVRLFALFVVEWEGYSEEEKLQHAKTWYAQIEKSDYLNDFSIDPDNKIRNLYKKRFGSKLFEEDLPSSVSDKTKEKLSLFKWTIDAEELKNLISSLVKEGLIADQHLCSHFETNDKPSVSQIKRVKWHGTEKQLAYLFNELRDRKYISDSGQLYRDITIHFVNKKGNEYKNKGLSSSFARAFKELRREHPPESLLIIKRLLNSIKNSTS